MPQFVRIHVCLCNWITHFVIYLFLLISAVFTSVTVQCLSCVAVTIIFLWNKAKRLEKKPYYFAFISTSLKARGAVLCSPKEEERRWAGFNQQSSSMIGPFDSGCCMSLPVYCFFLHLYSTYLCEAFKGKEILLSYFFFFFYRWFSHRSDFWWPRDALKKLCYSTLPVRGDTSLRFTALTCSWRAWLQWEVWVPHLYWPYWGVAAEKGLFISTTKKDILVQRFHPRTPESMQRMFWRLHLLEVSRTAAGPAHFQEISDRERTASVQTLLMQQIK